MNRISLRRVGRWMLVGGLVTVSAGALTSPALARRRSSVAITGPTSVKLGTNFSFKVTGFLAAPASDISVYELPNTCPAKVSGAIGSGGELQQIAPRRGHKFSLNVKRFARVPGAHYLCAYVFNRRVPSRKTYAHAQYFWSNHDKAAACPVAGQCGENPKTHCPTEGPLQAGPHEKCVSMSAALKIIVTNEPGGGCVQNDYVQVQLQRNIHEYEMVWYSTVGLGTRWWTNGDATVGPGSVTGEGASYQVPRGYAAVSAAGGAGGPGSCSGSAPNGTYGVAAWGIPDCAGSSARAAAHAAAAACCDDTPVLTGRATRDTSTGDVSVDLSASRLGRISTCGRAKMSITDPGHGKLYLQVNQHGTSATAHRDLAGSDQCLDLTRATVSVPKGGTAHRDVQVPDSVIRIAHATAHRTPQGAISLTVTANHFLPACGKREFSWQSPDGIDTLPIVRAKGSTATAKRTLPSGQNCAPDGTIQVVQRRDPWSHAARQVIAPAPFPTVCVAH